MSPEPQAPGSIALILASASPRRAELLRAAGLDFTVVPVAIDERPLDGETPPAYVERLAREKAQAAMRNESSSLVILAADTTVVIDGVLLGKPADAREATEMLSRLAGRTHEVMTGVAVVPANRQIITAVDTTRVRFVEMTPDDIAWYVASGEPFGKAGAYGIQGRASRFVDRVEGSYTNVVGLPIATVWRLLRAVEGLGPLEPGA
ncbi:MAG TPA: Maf family protein [Vicinamibacterales bacterium]|nr:Maf family protein [Vicinamibacterales bacterium]